MSTPVLNPQQQTMQKQQALAQITRIQQDFHTNTHGVSTASTHMLDSQMTKVKNNLKTNVNPITQKHDLDVLNRMMRDNERMQHQPQPPPPHSPGQMANTHLPGQQPNNGHFTPNATISRHAFEHMHVGMHQLGKTLGHPNAF